MLNNAVVSNVGESFISIVPFVGALGVFVLVMNFTGLIGISSTKNFSVTLTLALISFVMVQGYAIKKNGVGGYFKKFRASIFYITNYYIGKSNASISLSLRLFGNMLAATL